MHRPRFRARSRLWRIDLDIRSVSLVWPCRSSDASVGLIKTEVDHYWLVSLSWCMLHLSSGVRPHRVTVFHSKVQRQYRAAQLSVNVMFIVRETSCRSYSSSWNWVVYVCVCVGGVRERWSRVTVQSVQRLIMVQMKHNDTEHVSKTGLCAPVIVVDYYWFACLCVCVLLLLLFLRAHLHVMGMLRFMFDMNQLSLPTPFYSVIVSISVYGSFNCISFHKFSWQLSVFSLCSSGLISAIFILVLSIIYLFMKVFFSRDIIPSGWLGSKHQLTK